MSFYFTLGTKQYVLKGEMLLKTSEYIGVIIFCPPIPKLNPIEFNGPHLQPTWSCGSQLVSHFPGKTLCSDLHLAWHIQLHSLIYPVVFSQSSCTSRNVVTIHMITASAWFSTIHLTKLPQYWNKGFMTSPRIYNHCSFLLWSHDQNVGIGNQQVLYLW